MGHETEKGVRLTKSDENKDGQCGEMEEHDEGL